jgi:hypothetical protein
MKNLRFLHGNLGFGAGKLRVSQMFFDLLMFVGGIP